MNYRSLRKFAPQIKQIAEKHGILKVYVFGSTARDEASALSDIDFLVEMQEGVSLFGVGGFSSAMKRKSCWAFAWMWCLSRPCHKLATENL